MEHLPEAQKEACNSEEYKIFVQASCGSTANQQRQTNLVGLVLACLSVFGGYHFYIQMGIIFPKDVKITKANMDLRVATAGQYTI